MLEQIYISGDYQERNPSWHIEESPWKARQVIRMLRNDHIDPKIICEVGCGAGEVLFQLQKYMNDKCLFWGYDISPQAFELSKGKTNARLKFKLGDIRKEKDTFFDAILLMDVIEHLEDYYGFLRDVRPMSHYKILHIPLDLSVQTVLRRSGLSNVRLSYGHLHYFTKEIALQMLTDVGYDVIDYCYTARSLEIPSKDIKRNLMKLPRKLLSVVDKDMAARILGGWSLLVLAQ
ncbi:MAG: class I SAM-dependent methyltransferase [Ktedonobacteraceae bacterium]